MITHQYTSAANTAGSCSCVVVIQTTGCMCPKGLTTVCPLPCCCSSYYFDNDVGCVHSPLALDETSYEAGIKVQLHSQSEPPFLHELGFGVAPGFQTFVCTQEQRVAYDCLGLLHATNTVM